MGIIRRQKGETSPTREEGLSFFDPCEMCDGLDIFPCWRAGVSHCYQLGTFNLHSLNIDEKRSVQTDFVQNVAHI